MSEVQSMSAFMRKNIVQYTAVEIVISKRFADENGNPIPWRIKVISQEEMEKITERCTHRIIDAKTGQERIETNRKEVMRELLETCVVHPNLKNAELQNSYGAMGAAELAGKMLLPGEYVRLNNAIMQAQGIDTGLEKDIKIVKN